MFWLFQLASFTGSFPPPVNRINALGSRNSCSEDNILAGDNEENVSLADKITHSTECKPATFLEQELSKIVHVIRVRFTRTIKKAPYNPTPQSHFTISPCSRFLRMIVNVSYQRAKSFISTVNRDSDERISVNMRIF